MFRVWRASLLQQQKCGHISVTKIHNYSTKMGLHPFRKKIKYHCSCYTTSGITILIPIPSPPEHEN